MGWVKNRCEGKLRVKALYLITSTEKTKITTTTTTQIKMMGKISIIIFHTLSNSVTSSGHIYLEFVSTVRAEDTGLEVVNLSVRDGFT